MSLWIALLALLICLGWLYFVLTSPPAYGRRRAAAGDEPPVVYRRAPKPEWTRLEIIRLKAMMPCTGCRKIAEIFNRVHDCRGETVGKTYVSNVIRKHRYEIEAQRRKVRNRRHRSTPPNRVWGLDLTGKTDGRGKLHWIVGVLDHGSRADLSLAVLKDKTSLALLRLLLDLVEGYGRPKAIRTDNERLFTSRLFRFALWLLGIRHQRTDLCCPWQNGRIERFFGTLKQKLDQWTVQNREQLEESLRLFRVWYNHVRPHQHLRGMTPAEAWSGVDVRRHKPRGTIWFDAWDGLLTGYYIRR